MKHIHFKTSMLLLLLLTLSITAAAQGNRKFSVVSFALDQFDMTAQNEEYKKIDGSGSLYAIIKVSSGSDDDNLTEYRFNFGNMNHEVVQKDEKLWVYVQRNAKYVTISRKGFATVERYDLGTTIEAGRTYVMTLSAAPERIYTQMVMFSVTPPDSKAVVTVKASSADAVEEMVGITDETGATAKGLPYGSYTYKVVADGYYPTSGQFSLNDMAQTHEEKVVLKPRFGTVTLRTDGDADIYVNGELKGRGTWTGRLNGGSYQVECRQTNHRPSSMALTVKENETRTVDLPSPTPITGMLSILSAPLGASIVLDGQPQGTTPRQIPQLMIGRHSVVLSKEGYEDATQTVDVLEDETTNLNVTMKKGIATVVNNGNDRTFTVKGVRFVMKAVAGDTFRMGSDDSDADSDEKPVHSVTLSSYLMGETEVTQELWRAVMGSNPSHFKGLKRPVEQVSWNDCQEFIQKLNEQTGHRFRLPTEAEWVFAARGGNLSKAYQYAGSNSIGDVAWYTDNSSGTTHDVKTKAPNELGLYDMSGNVWEWCQDCYGNYSSADQTNPTGPSTGSYRVLRGGSCRNYARDCRVSNRDDRTPSYRSKSMGFRLVL